MPQGTIKKLIADKGFGFIATDAEGYVLRTFWEVPSISDVRALLRAVDL